MRNFLLLLLAFLSVIQVPSFDRASAAPPQPTIRPGVVLVRFRDEVAPPGSPAPASYEAVETNARLPFGVREWAVAPGRELALSRLIAADPGVLYAEPDYQARALAIPNDPHWSKQWSMVQIGAPAAWNVVTATGSITVAIIDSGAHLAHPDLAGSLWANPGEIAGNRLDDDRNGKIDDVNGWRFYHRYTSTGYVAEEDGRVGDDYGHGTHVAGIVAAGANNATGVAGLSWTGPLMTVKVLDQFGAGWYSDIAAGIVYAVDNGAKVINISAGGAEPSAALCEAAAYANGKGALLVGAAGNGSGATLYYPAACEHVLSVGATGPADAHASFSNAGPGLDLSAPGVDIYSTWYATGTQISTYFARSGTSQAAAHVSGAAALVWARWPGLSADQVAAQLTGSAHDVAAPGWDAQTGWGRLDVGQAVAARVEAADLQLRAWGTPNPVFAAQPYTLAFAITNAGPGDATSVSLQAALPAGAGHVLETGDAQGWSCSLAGLQLSCGTAILPAGASVELRVSFRPEGTGDGKLRTSASVAAAQRDPAGGNNSVTITDEVAPSLSGYVFIDPNGDGVRQPWETTGLAGAGLWLEREGQPISYATSLSPDGAYRFYALEPGEYDLFAGIPPEYVLAPAQPVKVLIATGVSALANFGVRRAGDPLITVTPSPTPTRTPAATSTPTTAPTLTPTSPVGPTATPSPTRPAPGRQFLPLLWRG